MESFSAADPARPRHPRYEDDEDGQGDEDDDHPAAARDGMTIVAVASPFRLRPCLRAQRRGRTRSTPIGRAVDVAWALPRNGRRRRSRPGGSCTRATGTVEMPSGLRPQFVSVPWGCGTRSRSKLGRPLGRRALSRGIGARSPSAPVTDGGLLRSAPALGSAQREASARSLLPAIRERKARWARRWRRLDRRRRRRLRDRRREEQARMTGGAGAEGGAGAVGGTGAARGGSRDSGST